MKKVLGVYTSHRPHWMGDGFPVRTLFSYDSLGKHISPFLLLDLAGPQDFQSGRFGQMDRPNPGPQRSRGARP
ncbi:Pirin-like protein [Pseudomonas sp. ATCC 13867]|nr:Pirin-like protein [Pseudomonas sp. ATCC 13867]